MQASILHVVRCHLLLALDLHTDVQPDSTRHGRLIRPLVWEGVGGRLAAGAPAHLGWLLPIGCGPLWMPGQGPSEFQPTGPSFASLLRPSSWHQFIPLEHLGCASLHRLGARLCFLPPPSEWNAEVFHFPSHSSSLFPEVGEKPSPTGFFLLLPLRLKDSVPSIRLGLRQFTLAI